MGHDPADALEDREDRVPLVEVQHRGLDRQRREGAHSPDAQDELLGEARLEVRVVEARRQDAVGLGVGRHRAVEQYQLVATDARAVDRDLDVATRAATP